MATLEQSNSEQRLSVNEDTPLLREPEYPPKLLDLVVMFLFGLTASTIGSLIGAGGGVLLTPLLVFYGVSQHRAHGTSLCVITITALISSIKYISAGQTDLFAAAALTLTAVLTSPLGARQSARVNAATLKRYFGAFLIFVSALIPTLPYILNHLPALTLTPSLQRIFLAIVGAGTGFLSGLLGIGGGTVNVPALVLLTGFSQKLAQGTSMAAMLIPSFRASFEHLNLGQVAMPFLPALGVGAVAGGALGASIALYLPEQTLRIVCAILLAGIGFKYLLKSGRAR